MPRIHRAALRGMSLEDLLGLLQEAVEDGTYPPRDIEKIRGKIEKRLYAGESMITHEIIEEIEQVDNSHHIGKKGGGMG